MPVGPSSLAAGLLSWLWPGLGQVASGHGRRGLAFAVPAAVILVIGVGILAAQGGILDALLNADILAGLLVLNLAFAVDHLAAIADAYRLAGRQPDRQGTRGRRSTIVLAVVLAGTIGLHGAIGVVAYDARETVQAVFVLPDDRWAVPTASFEPLPTPSLPAPTLVAAAPTATAAESASPSETPTEPPPTVAPSPTVPAGPVWAVDGRLNLLLIGSDAGPDRWSLRTDTVMLLSIDVASARAALFGIPRNMTGVPLPAESAGAFPSGQFPGLLNALYVYAKGHPDQFPGGDAAGFRAVTGAIQELVGVPIDGVIVVNLRGFVQLVDAIGGLWIDIREELVDSAYPLEDGSGYIQLDFKLGCQHLDGRMALAYARSRRQDSDYGRMRRQQDVMAALGRQVKPLSLLPKVPTLLRIARNNLWTTIAAADMSGLASVAARVSVDRLATVRFVPSRYPAELDLAGIEMIRSVVRTIFDGPLPSLRRDLPRRCP